MGKDRTQISKFAESLLYSLTLRGSAYATETVNKPMIKVTSTNLKSCIIFNTYTQETAQVIRVRLLGMET